MGCRPFVLVSALRRFIIPWSNPRSRPLNSSLLCNLLALQFLPCTFSSTALALHFFAHFWSPFPPSQCQTQRPVNRPAAWLPSQRLHSSLSWVGAKCKPVSAGYFFFKIITDGWWFFLWGTTQVINIKVFWGCEVGYQNNWVITVGNA
jgi:hypothetical protein